EPLLPIWQDRQGTKWYRLQNHSRSIQQLKRPVRPPNVSSAIRDYANDAVALRLILCLRFNFELLNGSNQLWASHVHVERCHNANIDGKATPFFPRQWRSRETCSAVVCARRKLSRQVQAIPDKNLVFSLHFKF